MKYKWKNPRLGMKTLIERSRPEGMVDSGAITREDLVMVHGFANSTAGEALTKYLEKEMAHWNGILHLAKPDDATTVAIAQTAHLVLESFLNFLRSPLPPEPEEEEQEEQ